VDFFNRTGLIEATGSGCSTKPNVWSGPHRITDKDWWIVATQRNTGLCLSKSEWFAVADDRSVLGPQWLQAVREAMEGGYAVAGAYEKVHNMVVENGVVMSCVEPIDANGNATGKDPRRRGNDTPRQINGDAFLGCTSALPLEWALRVTDGMKFKWTRA
jgi:hypothetical protein